MNDTELERMTAVLDGDGSGYQKMLDDAVKTTDQATASIEKNGSMIQRFGESIKTYAGTALQALAGMGIKSFLTSSMHEFEESEMGMIRLEAAIKANGGNVEELSEKYKEFAGRMQETTVYSDDMVISLLKQAESLQLSGDSAIRATEEAIRLGAATGESAASMMRLTAAMEKGDTKQAMMLSRRSQYFRGIKDEQEFVDRYNKLVATGMETVEKEANTLGGTLKIVTNLWSDFKEAIGEAVAGALKPIVGVIRGAVDLLNSLDGTTKTFIATAGMLTVGILALAVAVKTAGILFNLYFGGVGIWIGLFATLIGLTGGLAVSLGGFGEIFEGIKRRALQAWAWLAPVRARISQLWDDFKAWATRAWDYVVEKATQAWEWTKPVRQALQSLFSFLMEAGAAGWDFIVETATDAWDWIVKTAEGAWTSIFGHVEVNWKKIARSIQAGILFIEYSLRNLDNVFEIAWLNASYGLTKFAEDVKFFFLTTIPELLDWFAEEWPNVIIDAIDMSMKYIENRFSNLATLFGNLMAILSGEKSVTGLFGGLVDEFDGVEARFTNLPKLTEREMTEVERILKEGAETAETEFMQGFEEFYKNKLREFNVDPLEGIKNQAEEKGQRSMNNFTEGAAKEAAKADAVLAGSFKAFERIGDYLDNLYGEKSGGKKGLAEREFGGFDNRMAPVGGRNEMHSAPSKTTNDKMMEKVVKVLEQIRDKPQTVLTTTDLEG